ncbi:MAG: transferrin-binding protein-like solute binding protein [Pseudomonadota bacterium]
MLRQLYLTAALVGLAACNGNLDGFEPADPVTAAPGSPILLTFSNTTFPLEQHTAAVVINSSGRGGAVSLGQADGSPANMTNANTATLITQQFGDFQGLALGSVSGTDTSGNMTVARVRDSFVGYGSWIHEPASSNVTMSGYHYGLQTPIAALPRSAGSATYNGSASAVYFAQAGTGSRRFRQYSGTLSLTVNFNQASNQVTGTISGLSSGTSTIETLNLEGTRTNVTFAGTIEPSGGPGSIGFDPTARGTFDGRLYGPAFENAGGSGSISDANGTLVVGFGGD